MSSSPATPPIKAARRSGPERAREPSCRLTIPPRPPSPTAASIGLWLSRRLGGGDVLPYVAAQLVGACAASASLLAMCGNRAMLGATMPAGSAWQSFSLEAVLPGLLMLVILNVSTGPKETGILAGIAIGGVIGLEAMFAGPICGASMNPARSLAPAVVSGHLASLWVYLAAPVLGAAVAVPLWKIVRPCNGEK